MTYTPDLLLPLIRSLEEVRQANEPDLSTMYLIALDDRL